MFGISYLDISGSLGLVATGLLTFNFLLGMMLSSAYKRFNWWKKMPEKIKGISLDRLHNWTAYIALLFVLLHPVFLFMDPESKFGIKHIFFPLQSPKQPWLVMLGSISLLAIVVVILTTQKTVKKKMGFRFWKNVHLISYLTALLFLFHGLLMDPLLKDRPTDFMDAEKFFSECCLLILLLAAAARFRYYLKNQKKV